METTKKLLMSFKLENGKKTSISIEDPRENITEDEIKTVMDLIVEKGIFTPSFTKIVETIDAKIIVTDTTDYDLITD